MPDPSILPKGFMLQIIIGLLILGELARLGAWFMGKRGSEEEREAKEATRRAIASFGETLAATDQRTREVVVVAEETRQLVRGLREDNIRSAQTAETMVKAVDKLEVALNCMASSIRELVMEMRAERKAER